MYSQFTVFLLALAHRAFINSVNVVLAFGFCFAPTPPMLHAGVGAGGRGGQGCTLTALRY